MKSFSSFSRNIGFWLIFFLIIGFAFLTRIYRAELGLPYLHYWDEPQTASTALRILKTGNFNPWFFNYGTLPIYINYFVDVLHYLYLMGQPTSASSYLNALTDIKTFEDTQWIWTISHPSFYYWNRVTSVMFGTASVALTFLIARNVFNNKWVALVAALFIASIIPHAEFSALITPDIPMGFFVLATTYFSLRFIDDRKTWDFLLSLIFSGCAAATKYNSVLVLLVPSISMCILYVRDRNSFNLKWLAMLPVVPAVTFFICMPYAWIDTVSFLKALGFELRHYKILGHGEFTIGAGIRHIRFQAAQILNNIGAVSAVVITVGLFASIKKPKLLLVAVFPIAYFFYMTTTIINFHRNFLIIYPFLAVGYAGAFYLTSQFSLLRLTTLFNNGAKDSVPVATTTARFIWMLILSLLLLNVLILSYSSLLDAKKIKLTFDSRTLVIDQINSLAAKKEILVPVEIRMHEHDTRRLTQKFKEVSLEDLFSCAGKDSADLAIVPERIMLGGRNDIERELTRNYPSWMKRLDTVSAKLTVGKNPLSLDHLSVDPKLYVFERNTLALSNPNCR